MTSGRPEANEPTHPGGARSSATGSALEDVLRQWESSLEVAVRREAGRAVRKLLEDQRALLKREPAGAAAAAAARQASETTQDAVVAFALFYQDYLRATGSGLQLPLGPAADKAESAADPSRGTGGPTPAVATSSSVRADRPSRDARLQWTKRVPKLADPGLATLLELLANALIESGTKEDAWTLRALLHVFFEVDWSASADLLPDVAHRAGQLLCKFIMAQPGAARSSLLAQGRSLINAHALFAAVYECRSLPERGPYDRTVCDEPDGARAPGSEVTPLSFYIVRKQTDQPVRRARVQWAS